MKEISSAIVFILIVSIIGCTPWRAKYLAEVLGKASQDEIAQKLGAPNATYQLKSGGQVWSYDHCYGTVSGSDGQVSGRTRCDKYVLTFDEAGILRNWVRQK
jgi:hypothetical protein